jgi:hypothetical protein
MSNSEHLQELSFDVADWPPSTESPAVTDVETTLVVISSRPHHSQGTLPLLQLADWSKDNAYEPYCWRDNVGKKNYKLKTHHLKSLIKHVEQGGTLETHDDVPDDIREQLYAKEQQDVERQRKRRAFSLADFPPINITNVLPSQTSTLSTETVPSKPSSPLEILGQLDVAVRKYSEWQCSWVTNKSLKIEYQKAYNITLAEGLDLELVYKEQNA